MSSRNALIFGSLWTLALTAAGAAGWLVWQDSRRAPVDPESIVRYGFRSVETAAAPIDGVVPLPPTPAQAFAQIQPTAPEPEQITLLTPTAAGRPDPSVPAPPETGPPVMPVSQPVAAPPPPRLELAPSPVHLIPPPGAAPVRLMSPVPAATPLAPPPPPPVPAAAPKPPVAAATAALAPPPPPPPPPAAGGEEAIPDPAQGLIVISVPERQLRYFPADGSAPITYPVAIGRSRSVIPFGASEVVRKRRNPTWRPTPTMRRDDPSLPESVPPGPDNPLGAYALDLGWTYYAIHGTNNPRSIGRAASSGCFRMHAKDIEALYKTVPVGTKVEVIDAPLPSAPQSHPA